MSLETKRRQPFCDRISLPTAKIAPEKQGIHLTVYNTPLFSLKIAGISQDNQRFYYTKTRIHSFKTKFYSGYNKILLMEIIQECM